MNLLSDDEIRKVFDDVQSARATAPWFIRYAQALQVAILAKLASAELPEPVVIDRHESGIVIRGYTSGQLQQAHAQGFAAGAAAQLAEKPSGYLRKWAFDGETPVKERKENGRMAWPDRFKLLPVTEIKLMQDDLPLYTRKESK